MWESAKLGGMPRKALEFSQMFSLGWKPRVPLRERLQRTYAYYVRHSGAAKEE